jgi:putative endonuclease
MVYVLRSDRNGQLYVGYTTNLKNRIERHNKGNVISTKSKRPWKLIFAEAYISQSDALRREQYFKTTQGKIALKHMLRETLKLRTEILSTSQKSNEMHH